LEYGNPEEILNMPDQTATRSFPADRLQALAPRRTTHGSCAWTLPSSISPSLRQPQDGAPTFTGVRSIDSRTSAANEPDDAVLSGSLRSLARRVMGLNVMKPMRMATAVTRQDVRRETARKAPDAARKPGGLIQVA
jgi:hypothetical protein